jgi:serine/threonine protein kinase
VGGFGEVYRALGVDGQEARLVHVDPRLAAQPAFAGALMRFGESVVRLDHPRLAGVNEVGRSGDELFVVTGPLGEAVSVREILSRSAGPLPAGVALAIAAGAIDGLAHAHAQHVAHGAIHPRSVLIDDRGGVILADFGLAHALVEAAAETDDARELLRDLRGYLAPELALGQPPSEATDVYAAGALLFELLHGEPPPGELRVPAELGRVLERALATDPSARLATGGELAAALAQAIAAAGSALAPPDQLARLAGDASLPAEHAGRLGRVTDLLDELEQENGATGQAPAALEVQAGGELRGDPTDPDPDVDLIAGTDLSRALDIDDLPPPSSARAGSGADEAVESTPLPLPARPRPGSVTRHLDALEAEEEAAAAMARPPRVFPWIAGTALVLVVVGGLLYTQTDLFDTGRRAAEARAADMARQAELARIEAAQPVPGDLTIASDEADAAVWLLLGRTPVESLPLSAAMVHELRVEHEGYQALDLRVTGYQWTDQAGPLRADVVAELEPGGSQRPPPAYPPASTEPPGGPSGRGVIHVKSNPPGAQVWLLIGFTPRVTISGLQAARTYEVKVIKDGFRPGFAAVREEDWYLSGPGGPVQTSLTRQVALEPAKKDRPGRTGKSPRPARSKRADAPL